MKNTPRPDSDCNYQTLVIEGPLLKPFGMGSSSTRAVERYLQEQMDLFKGFALGSSQTDPAEQYGLSAVGAWEMVNADGHAVVNHLYFWDTPFPFVSIDIIAPHHLLGFETFIEHAEKFFSFANIAWKTSSNPNTPTWENLGEGILRQRLELKLALSEPLSDPAVVDPYLKDLAPALCMNHLYGPVHFQDKVWWMHWVTSGTVTILSEDRQHLLSNIYTCKAFKPEDAIAYTLDKFSGSTLVSSREF